MLCAMIEGRTTSTSELRSLEVCKLMCRFLGSEIVKLQLLLASPRFSIACIANSISLSLDQRRYVKIILYLAIERALKPAIGGGVDKKEAKVLKLAMKKIEFYASYVAKREERLKADFGGL